MPGEVSLIDSSRIVSINLQWLCQVAIERWCISYPQISFNPCRQFRSDSDWMHVLQYNSILVIRSYLKILPLKLFYFSFFFLQLDLVFKYVFTKLKVLHSQSTTVKLQWVQIVCQTNGKPMYASGYGPPDWLANWLINEKGDKCWLNAMTKQKWNCHRQWNARGASWQVRARQQLPLSLKHFADLSCHDLE